MVRALVTLLGAAGALALLYLAPEAGDELGNGLWGVAFAIAAAGFVLGLLYQAGGVRRPGVRLNPWLLLLVALPWTLLSIGVVAQVADSGSNIADWTRDVVPEDVLARWVTVLPALALGSGLLLALALLEPRIGRREAVEPLRHTDERFVPTAGGDPLDVGRGTGETFSPDPVPVRSASAWDAGTASDTAVTRVTPAVRDESTVRDDATAILPSEPRSGGPIADGERTVVIRPSDDTESGPGARR